MAGWATITLASAGLFAFVATAPAHAAGADFSLDFTAAAPLTYDHSTGGGAYNDRTVGKADDIVESLQGGDFTCGDKVTFLTEISVAAGGENDQTILVDFSFLADTTGQSGAAIGNIAGVSINYGAVSNGAGAGNTDSGINDDGGSTATLVSQTLTAPLFGMGAELLATVEVDGLDAGEQVILRVDTQLECDPGSSPTGNLQAMLESATVIDVGGNPVDPADGISSGAQTIPFQKIGQLPIPDVMIDKSADKSSVSASGENVTYTVMITNNGEIELTLDSLMDDKFGDLFDAGNALFSANSCPDLSGDILAVGDSTSCTFTTFLTGAEGVPHVNTVTLQATANGVNGISDMDSATVNFTAFIPSPSMTVVKSSTTTGLSAPGTVTYKYLVTNTGNVTLTGISLVDDNDENDMSCPANTLNVGANMTCTATHDFTQAELDADGSPTGDSGKLTNNVTASSNEAADAKDKLDIPISQSPGIDIQKTPDNQDVVVGADATFTIKVHEYVTVEFDVVYPAGGFVYINQHMDDGVKGRRIDVDGDGNPERYEKSGPNGLDMDTGELTAPDMADHTFCLVDGLGVPIPSAFDDDGCDTVQSVNDFKRLRGVGGYVGIGPMEDGMPIAGATVTLYDPKGGVAGTTTTDEDGWYGIAFKHKGKPADYTVVLTIGGDVEGEATVRLKGNTFVEVNFDVSP